MSLNNLPVNGAGLKEGVYTAEHFRSQGTGRGLGRGQVRGQVRGRGRGFVGRDVSVHLTGRTGRGRGLMVLSKKTPDFSLQSAPAKTTCKSDEQQQTPNLQPVIPSLIFSAADGVAHRKQLIPPKKMEEIESLVNQSVQLNNLIPKYQEKADVNSFPDAKVRKIHNQFIEIFRRIDSLLEDDQISPEQKSRLRERAKKNTNSIKYMLSRLIQSPLDRKSLTFELTLELLELNTQPELDTESRKKVEGWLKESTNNLAYTSITKLDQSVGNTPIELLEQVRSAIERHKISQPEKALYNLHYSLAVWQLREGQFEQARCSLNQACSHHNSGKLHVFLSVTKALESSGYCGEKGSDVPVMPTSKAENFPVRDVNGMTDDCLLNFAQEALQHCRQQLQLR